MNDERADIDNTIGDAPIEDTYVQKMRALAHVLDKWLNDEKEGDERHTGFVLLIFPFDDHQGRCNYISNADRDDIKVLLREQLARFEGRATGEGGKA